mmetsp:Transcript_37793/g.96751  ORF Transcript_37793/g.96751 Transcript_37793/m.96751 type:complete len:602 (-) Transcript_37793:110-1915(-)
MRAATRSGRVAPAEEDEEMRLIRETGARAKLVHGAGQKPNAIPVEFADMRERLIEDHEHVFTDIFGGASKARQRTFRRFADRIWIANHMRLNRLFQKWLESYMYFNPDHGGVEHPKNKLSSTQFDAIESKWRSMLYTVLEKGGFAMVADSDLEEAVASRDLGGINLLPPPPEAVEYEIFYRGVKSCSKEVRSWRTWFRRTKIAYKEYGRLMVLYRIKAKPEDVQAKQRTCCGRPFGILVRVINMFSLGGETVTPIEETDPQLWYMKIFKDVSSLDVDMVVPGGSIDFTWFDVAMIWVPTLIGFGSAIKTIYDVWGQQDSWIDWFVLVVLFILPLSWGFKAYQSIKHKENQYMVHIGNVYMTQNLNNNQGVCGDLLEEAHEQENNEALLAYFFLWNGMQEVEFQEKGALDRTVEAYLTTLKEHYDSDFDVADALDKLVQMGICTRKTFPNAMQMFKVVNLEEACELINPVRISAFINSLGNQHGRGPCAMSDWREALAPGPPGERPVRYFINSATGQRCYDVPDDYIPINFNSSLAPGVTSPARRASSVAADAARNPDSFVPNHRHAYGIPPSPPQSVTPPVVGSPVARAGLLPPLKSLPRR